MKQLTDNSRKIEVGSRVIFPRQENGDWNGVVVELIPDVMMWENHYVVHSGDNVYRFTKQEYVSLFPEVGMPATMTNLNDSNPATVVSVSKSGKQITVRGDAWRPVPNSEFASNEWNYFEDEEGPVYTYKLNKHGRWTFSNRYLFVGNRSHYYNYSF